MTAFNPGEPVHVSFDGVVGEDLMVGDTIHVRLGDYWHYRFRPEHLSPVPTPVLFPDIRKGDRIQVVGNGQKHEFVVAGIDGDHLYSSARHAFVNGYGWQFFRLTPPVPPEPEYEVGAVYQDADGLIYRRRVDEWVDFNGELWGHTDPTRPLVRLVPEEPK